MSPQRDNDQGCLFGIAAAVGIIVIASLVYASTPWSVPRPEALDGDTIRTADGKPDIRLARVDAPELYCPSGAASQAFLAGALAAGPLRCRELRTDVYGRRLAECTINGLNVSDALLRAGKAAPYSKEKHGLCE